MRKSLVRDILAVAIVVLDNLGSYNVIGSGKAVQAASSQLRYLLPYNPNYEPIEKVFARLKTLRKKAAKRTINLLCVGHYLAQT